MYEQDQEHAQVLINMCVMTEVEWFIRQCIENLEREAMKKKNFRVGLECSSTLVQQST